MKPAKPKQTKGPAHVIAAFGYSLAGLRCLWKEVAFRLELLGGALGLTILIVAGASASRLLLFVLLFLAVLVIEALNTAVEMIVDKTSPEWSEFGKKTKDVGSAAVFLMIIANGVYFSATLFEILYL